jgi:hypothetical protein
VIRKFCKIISFKKSFYNKLYTLLTKRIAMF